MLALQKTRPETGLALVEVPPLAEPGEGEVRVSVLASGICGSDLHVDDWTSSYTFIMPALPVTLGHEFVGIAETGPLAGQRVVVRPSVTCGRSQASSSGMIKKHAPAIRFVSTSRRLSTLSSSWSEHKNGATTKNASSDQ